MKKKMAFAVAGVLAASIIVSCGKAESKSDGSGASAQTVQTADGKRPEDSGKIMILYPGDETDEMASFIEDDLNPKLKKEIGEEIQIIYKGWDQYWDQKNIMLAAGNAVDLYWDGLSDIGTLVNEKQCQPIDDLLEEYGQDLLKVIPEEQLAGGKVKGKQYGIPSAYAPSSCMYQLVCLRKDLLDETGMKDVQTPEDLKAFAEKVKEKHPELSGPADVIFKPLTRYYEDEPLTWCAYGDSVVFGEESKKAMCYFETPAFEKVARFNRSMYEAGLYRDELTTNYNERDSRMQQGTYLWVEGSIGKENEIRSAVRVNAPNAELKSYLLAPEKSRYISSCGGEVLCIPYSAQNPVGAMKFLNWLYKSEENYLFAIYGPEGENYTMEGDRMKLKDASFGGYFYEWMFRNKNYQKFSTDISDEFIKTYENWDKDAKYSAVMAFHFDDANVKGEETAISEVINKNMMPILCGYVDYDSEFPKVDKMLKDAGIDRYVAEVQRQIDEYLAENK